MYCAVLKMLSDIWAYKCSNLPRCRSFSSIVLRKVVRSISDVYFWSTATEEPGGLRGLRKSSQPSLQKICEERFRVHTNGRGWVFPILAPFYIPASPPSDRVRHSSDDNKHREDYISSIFGVTKNTLLLSTVHTLDLGLFGTCSSYCTCVAQDWVSQKRHGWKRQQLSAHTLKKSFLFEEDNLQVQCSRTWGIHI